LQIVDSAPLVAVDLVIRNNCGRILLGKRSNRPAQGSWFVPGGRIRKNERIADTIGRVSGDELGVKLTAGDGELLGVYQHLYQDNFCGADAVNTHYVVLAYSYSLSEGVALRPDGQHAEMKWWPMHQLLRHSEVHEYTKAYFRQSAP